VLQPSKYLHPRKNRPKSGKAIYELQLNDLNNTSFRHVLSNLRNECVGLERHECIESFEQCYYCGKNEREL